MKNKNIIKFALALLSISVALALTITVFGVGQGNAKVTYFSGKAMRGNSSNGPWKALKKGDLIGSGHFVKTEKASRVELKLPDRSILRISSNSLFEISDSYFPKKKPRKFSAKLWLGSIWGRVTKKLLGKSKFKVSTQTAVAGVRGTVYSVSAMEDKSSMVKVYTGKVAVNPPGKEVAQADKKPDGEREEMAFPGEVTKEEWFDLLLTRMQAVTIAPDGTAGKPVSFDPKTDKDEWAAWNLERDKAIE